MAKNTKSENLQKADTSKNNTDDNKKDNENVFYLAKCIIKYGLFAVSILGLAAIIAAIVGPEDDKVDSIKDILGILLPVISAWIGAVIAYYFSKENFKSATDSTKELFTQFRTTEEKLQSISAKEVMIGIGSATKLVMKENQKEEEIKLIEHIIEGKLEPEGKNRLPILDHQMHPKYVIHRSIIDKFIVKVTTTPVPVTSPPSAGIDPKELTLQDMLDDLFFANILKNSFRTVSEIANLAQVKACIDKEDWCSDVFVTEDGGKKSKVLGWITNVDVTKKSVV